jgi:predicted nucleic acid-binding protein
MSEPPRKLYWDSSCFICLLNDADYELARRVVCEDVLSNAERGVVEIWTSTFTIVEVIRPKRHGSAPMPAWATRAIELLEKEFPHARNEMETLWRRYQSNDPAAKLTPEQIDKIQGMFEWDFVKLIELNQIIANDAVGLCRDYGLKAPDAIHAASALAKRCDVLQRYDRDFEKIRSRITVQDPQQISDQTLLFAAAPKPEDFKWPIEATVQSHLELPKLPDIPAGLLGTGDKVAEQETEKAKATDEGGPSQSGS